MTMERPLLVLAMVILYVSRSVIGFQQSSSKHFFTVLTAAVRSNDIALPLSQPRGVIFDMDGTLVRPCIDFADMRRRIYSVGSRDLSRDITEGCVLELTKQLSPAAQEEASLILHEIEQDAIDRMAFMDGMIDLCKWLDENHVKRAVLTRNVERSIDAFHDKLHPTTIPPFAPAVARNTVHPLLQTHIPAKPQPDAIHYICQEWNCLPQDVIMVGDSLKDDVVAANRAGCASIHLSMGEDNCSGNTNDSTLEEREPILTVSSLHELKEILMAQYEQLWMQQR